MAETALKIPVEIASIIERRGELESESRILLTLELYREGEISAGKAAELIDTPYEDFVEELKKRDMKLYGGAASREEARSEESRARKYLV